MPNAVLEDPIMRQQVMPMTVPTYQALGQMGLIEENTELIRGFILRKVAKSPRHTTLTQRLLKWVFRHIPSGYAIRPEQPLTCLDSEPEPDIAIVKGSDEDFAHAHPTTAALVIEVSVSTLERDLEKAFIYAEAGVQEYWLINPEQQHVVVYTQPGSTGYQIAKTIGLGKILSPSEFPEIQISLSELLR